MERRFPFHIDTAKINNISLFILTEARTHTMSSVANRRVVEVTSLLLLSKPFPSFRREGKRLRHAFLHEQQAYAARRFDLPSTTTKRRRGRRGAKRKNSVSGFRHSCEPRPVFRTLFDTWVLFGFRHRLAFPVGADVDTSTGLRVFCSQRTASSFRLQVWISGVICLVVATFVLFYASKLSPRDRIVKLSPKQADEKIWSIPRFSFGDIVHIALSCALR